MRVLHELSVRSRVLISYITVTVSHGACAGCAQNLGAEVYSIGVKFCEVYWRGRTLPSLSAKSSTRPGRSIRPSQSAQSLTTRHVVAPRSTPRVAVTGCETKMRPLEQNSGSIAVESRTEWVGNGRNCYSQPSSDSEVNCNYTNYVEDGLKCQNN